MFCTDDHCFFVHLPKDDRHLNPEKNTDANCHT
jgi:hypothetical protein